MTAKGKLKMFVWSEDVLTDYSDGMICVLAHSIEEAKEVLSLDSASLLQEVEGKEPIVYEEPSVVYVYGSS